MLQGKLPPFRVGEKRAFIYKDSIGGASPLEYLGLAALVGMLVIVLL